MLVRVPNESFSYLKQLDLPLAILEFIGVPYYSPHELTIYHDVIDDFIGDNADKLYTIYAVLQHNEIESGSGSLRTQLNEIREKAIELMTNNVELMVFKHNVTYSDLDEFFK